jgi:hypothetical protein
MMMLFASASNTHMREAFHMLVQHMKGFNLVVHFLLAGAQSAAFLLLGEQTVWWGS